MSEIALAKEFESGIEPEQVFSQGIRMSKLLMKALENSPEAVIEIQGKKYMKIQGWQVLGAFLGLTTEIVRIERLENGRLNGWLVEAELRNKLGERVARGYGICTRDEKGWKDKPEFALLAMAQTRAIGRALKLYCGWIVALAGIADTPYEEVEGVIEDKKEERPATEAQIKIIKDLCRKHGVAEPEYSKLTLKQASELIETLLRKSKEQAQRKAEGDKQVLIRSLHAWAKLAGFEEEEYKAYLKEKFGKDTSKDLTEEELREAIRDMRRAWHDILPEDIAKDIDPLEIKYKEASEITKKLEEGVADEDEREGEEAS